MKALNRPSICRLIASYDQTAARLETAQDKAAIDADNLMFEAVAAELAGDLDYADRCHTEARKQLKACQELYERRAVVLQIIQRLERQMGR